MKCCRSYFLKWIRKSFLFTRKAFIFYIPTANRVPGMHIYFRVHNLWWGKRHHFTSKVKNLSPSAEGFCSFTTLLTPEYPYFVSVLNFYSYLFIFPYKIVYCSNLKSFKLQTSTPRKAMCFLTHSALTSCIVLFVYPSIGFFWQLKANVNYLFLIVYLMSLAVGTTMVFKLAWFQKNDILQICNLAVDLDEPSSWKREKFYTFLIYFWTLVNFILHILQGIFSPTRVNAAKNAHTVLTWVLAPLLEYLGVNPVKVFIDMFGEEAISTGGIIIYAYCCSFIHLPVHLFLVLVLTTGVMVRTGYKETLCGNKIRLAYNRVKKTLSKIEQTFGGLILLFYIESLSFYAQLPYFFMYPGNGWIENVQLYNYLIIMGGSLYYASDVHQKVNELMQGFITQTFWQIKTSHLGKTDKYNGNLKMLALQKDLSNSLVGISCGLFTITKSFVGSTIGMVTTYALIVIQMAAG